DLSVALEEHLRLQSGGIVRVRLAPRGREDAAEGPAPLVLERGPPVRPQQVALVEDGVGDLPDRVGHSRPSSSSATASSHVGSARRALYATRRSKTSVRSRSHALPGKASSIASFQTRTGSR